MPSSYVYVYMDPRVECATNYLGIALSHKVFYVGKGKGGRCYDHLREVYKRGTLKDKLIDELQEKGFRPLIKKIYENISSEEAYYLENLWINHFKSYKDGGVLLNLQQGKGLEKIDVSHVDLSINDLSPIGLYTNPVVKYVLVDFDTFDILSAHRNETEVADYLRITPNLVRSVARNKYPHNVIKGKLLVLRADLNIYYTEILPTAGEFIAL